MKHIETILDKAPEVGQYLAKYKKAQRMQSFVHKQYQAAKNQTKEFVKQLEDSKQSLMYKEDHWLDMCQLAYWYKDVFNRPCFTEVLKVCQTDQSIKVEIIVDKKVPSWVYDKLNEADAFNTLVKMHEAFYKELDSMGVFAPTAQETEIAEGIYKMVKLAEFIENKSIYHVPFNFVEFRGQIVFSKFEEQPLTWTPKTKSIGTMQFGHQVWENIRWSTALKLVDQALNSVDWDGYKQR